MQHVIEEKVYDKKLMDDTVRKLAWKHLQENMIVNGNRLIDKRTVEVLGEALYLEVDYTRWENKF